MHWQFFSPWSVNGLKYVHMRPCAPMVYKAIMHPRVCVRVCVCVRLCFIICLFAEAKRYGLNAITVLRSIS